MLGCFRSSPRSSSLLRHHFPLQPCRSSTSPKCPSAPRDHLCRHRPLGHRGHDCRWRWATVCGHVSDQRRRRPARRDRVGQGRAGRRDSDDGQDENVRIGNIRSVSPPDMPVLTVGRPISSSRRASGIGLSTTVGLGQGCFRRSTARATPDGRNEVNNAGLFRDMASPARLHRRRRAARAAAPHGRGTQAGDRSATRPSAPIVDLVADPK